MVCSEVRQNTRRHPTHEAYKLTQLQQRGTLRLPREEAKGCPVRDTAGYNGPTLHPVRQPMLQLMDAPEETVVHGAPTPEQRKTPGEGAAARNCYVLTTTSHPRALRRQGRNAGSKVESGTARRKGSVSTFVFFCFSLPKSILVGNAESLLPTMVTGEPSPCLYLGPQAPSSYFLPPVPLRKGSE